MLARLDRALCECIISEQTFEDETCMNFSVIGSTGRIYAVAVSKVGAQKPTCTCMDYQRRKKPCKHILASLIQNTRLSVQQIEFFVDGAVSMENFETSTCNEDCPICHENIAGQHEYRCVNCNNCFHYTCIKQWFTICRRQRINRTCPMCRNVLN